MKSMAVITGNISLPHIEGEYSMIPFNSETFEGLTGQFLDIAKQMMIGIKSKGIAYLTIHGKNP